MPVSVSLISLESGDISECDNNAIRLNSKNVFAASPTLSKLMKEEFVIGLAYGCWETKSELVYRFVFVCFWPIYGFECEYYLA